MPALLRLPWLIVLFACGTSAPPADPGEALKATLRSHPLELTHHARCRMGCRDVTEGEIRQLLVDGTWKPERTRDDGACPSHALEGRSADGQSLRIVYAACDDATRVVTVIDLGADPPCDCD